MNGPLEVLFLTQTFPRFPDDTAGPFIRDLARGLVRRGDAVTVLTPHAEDVPERWQVDGVEVQSFRYAPERLEVIGYGRSLDRDESIRPAAALATPLFVAGARRALRRALRSRRFDLVHAHWVVPNVLVAAPVVGGVPLGVGLHGSDVFQAERPVLRTLTRRALGGAAFLTGCSPELVDRVCALGFPRELAAVIPYGVDVEIFAPAGADEAKRHRAAAWRQELGVPEDAPMILSVGRMVSKKGYDVLLEALPEILSALPEAHVVLAGAGDLLEPLRRQGTEFSGRLHLPGIVLRDRLPDLYRAADCFVLPAVHDDRGNVDGLPNVILEAMASGLPVVASEISGIPLAVIDGINGRLVPEREPKALSVALAEVAAEPDRVRRMGEAARKRAAAELTWDVVAGRYREAYVAGLDRAASRSAR